MGRRTSKPIKLEAPAAPPPPPDPRQGYLFADMWSDNDNQPDTAAPGYFGVRGAPKLKKARKR